MGSAKPIGEMGFACSADLAWANAIQSLATEALWGTLGYSGALWSSLGYSRALWGTLGYSGALYGTLGHSGVRCCRRYPTLCHQSAEPFAREKWRILTSRFALMFSACTCTVCPQQTTAGRCMLHCACRMALLRSACACRILSAGAYQQDRRYERHTDVPYLRLVSSAPLRPLRVQL